MLNLAGITLAAFPSVYIGWLHWNALKWEPKASSSEGVEQLRNIMSDFFREAARDVRPWHLVMTVVGITLNILSSFLKVVLSLPS